MLGRDEGLAAYRTCIKLAHFVSRNLSSLYIIFTSSNEQYSHRTFATNVTSQLSPLLSATTLLATMGQSDLVPSRWFFLPTTVHW